MDAAGIFLILCVLGASWNVVTTLIVYGALQKRGLPVSFLWLRLMAPRYVFQYKEITKSETGKVGPLFYHWIVSINLALVFAIVLAIVASS